VDGSADPDPYQNVPDLQHGFQVSSASVNLAVRKIVNDITTGQDLLVRGVNVNGSTDPQHCFQVSSASVNHLVMKLLMLHNNWSGSLGTRGKCERIHGSGSTDPQHGFPAFTASVNLSVIKLLILYVGSAGTRSKCERSTRYQRLDGAPLGSKEEPSQHCQLALQPWVSHQPSYINSTCKDRTPVGC
jgi:hypothetical protein